MPLYTRIGMHLLFYGSLEVSTPAHCLVSYLIVSCKVRFLRWRFIRNLLKSESIRREPLDDYISYTTAHTYDVQREEYMIQRTVT